MTNDIKLLLIVLTFTTICYSEQESEWQRRYDFSNIKNKTDATPQVITQDLSHIWKSESKFIVGYIGNNFQRFRIKFESVLKNPKNAKEYLITGKDRVKDNACEFEGKLTITKAIQISEIDSSCENDVKPQKTGFIIGEYNLIENPKCKWAGVFKGIFTTQYYVDSNNIIQYYNLDNCSDGFHNNDFIGKWKENGNGNIETCNWGDNRIPFSESLDKGAGEFSPDKAYAKFGWASYLRYENMFGITGINQKALADSITYDNQP